MKIAIKSNTEKPIDATSLLPLYANAGRWSERSEQDVNQMLQAAICVGTWEGDRLIGFARALSDIDVVSLFCDKAHIPFYQETGSKFSKSQHVMHMKKK